MKLRISQMSLFSGILNLIAEQAKEQGIADPEVSAAKLNAICKAATDITLEFDRDDVAAAPGMGLLKWLASDDTGTSSKAMAHHLCGAAVRRGDEKCHPLDPSDFGRCHRFLEAVPEARDNFLKMAGVSDVWARLVGAWDELTKLYLEELPRGTAPRLYARMKELGC